MDSIDVSKLNAVDRLGVAACRLLQWEWDDILGAKPEGFDDLPNFIPGKSLKRSNKSCKSDYVGPAIHAIEGIIGKANISRCWWKYFLGKSEEEWLQWYVGVYIKAGNQSNTQRRNSHKGSERSAPQAAEKSAISQSCRRFLRRFRFKDD